MLLRLTKLDTNYEKELSLQYKYSRKILQVSWVSMINIQVTALLPGNAKLSSFPFFITYFFVYTSFINSFIKTLTYFELLLCNRLNVLIFKLFFSIEQNVW